MQRMLKNFCFHTTSDLKRIGNCITSHEQQTVNKVISIFFEVNAGSDLQELRILKENNFNRLFPMVFMLNNALSYFTETGVVCRSKSYNISNNNTDDNKHKNIK
jgi:hypothetical protein